jgi:dienelactone hydrolase
MREPFGSAIRDYGEELKKQGNVVLIPLFFGSISPGGPALDKFIEQRNNWVKTIGDVLSFATTLKVVRSDKLGLLGFSMGGHLAIWSAQSSAGPKVSALVIFYAPIIMPPLFTGIGDNLRNLPATLIHHGTKDDFPPGVPTEQTTVHLRRLLIAAGKVEGSDFRIVTYEGEGHVFKTPAAIASSKAATTDFFRKHL